MSLSVVCKEGVVVRLAAFLVYLSVLMWLLGYCLRYVEICLIHPGVPFVGFENLSRGETCSLMSVLLADLLDGSSRSLKLL